MLVIHLDVRELSLRLKAFYVLKDFFTVYIEATEDYGEQLAHHECVCINACIVGGSWTLN
jgi:hypothetical protein